MRVVQCQPRIAAPALAVLLLLTALPARAGLDLSGVVRDTSGTALPGADVYIFAAAPRVGPRTLCPSCYPDCEKQAKTGSDGRFTFPGLAESLAFRVLVGAKGYDPRFVEDVDPASGAIEVRLSRRKRARLSDQSTLWGVVKDPRGDPVPGAVVQPVGWRWRPEEPFAVTDERGEFVLANRTSFVRVTARNLAPRVFQELHWGEQITLRLTHGATIIGRLLRAGEPVHGAIVRLGPWDGRAEPMVGSEEIATDANGNFTFANVAPRESVFVWVPATNLAPGEVVTIRPFATGDDDSSTRVAALAIRPALRLRGQVTLSDGRPVSTAASALVGGVAVADGRRASAATVFLVVRRRSGEEIRAPVDSAGRFDCLCVPPGESVPLTFELKNYHVSPKTPGCKAQFGLWISPGDTLDDIQVILDPGLLKVVLGPPPGGPYYHWPFTMLGDPRVLLQGIPPPQEPIPTPPLKRPPQ